MLVLSRKKGQKIVIGNDGSIVIEIVAILRGNKARIGITAPKDIPVHREEIYNVIQREKAERAEQEKVDGMEDALVG